MKPPTFFGSKALPLSIPLVLVGGTALWLFAQSQNNGKSSPGEVIGGSSAKPPRLVLQITVDQLRGDMHRRYLHRMGEGGFRYLENEGVVFEDANHAHANTETIVGHTTLATGAYPSIHGMVGNGWFDRSTGNLVYNIEDARYPLLDKSADIDKEAEIDPDQAAATTDGRSPAAILSSTFSDELSIHTAGKAKIFGVSVKDRAAVSMAGHAGKAFWFSKATGAFTTSSFYYDAYPDWVNEFNEAEPAKRYGNRAWELLHERDSYVFAENDDQPWETSMLPFGRTFPHRFGSPKGKGFTTFLTLSPAGDELTLDFTKKLIENESLGEDEVTDYLSVSFSSTDYVGHMFGISSLESEDNLLRLDRTLADLFAFVDENVGLENALIVLSADHGGPHAPPLLQKHGIEAGYVDPGSWDKAPGIARLKERFGIGQELILDFRAPYVYLDLDFIREKGLDLAEVENAVAEEVSKLEGVSMAISSTALMQGQLPDTNINRLVLNAHHTQRSGDLFIVFKPHWFINDFAGLKVAATHGSPWRYDTFVPVIFAGAGLRPRRVYRPIETVDVASTLSTLLGTNQPSGAVGEVLPEVMESIRRYGTGQKVDGDTRSPMKPKVLKD